jgi:transcription initiation factor TFIIIB Brf1 subunit/transcription initiation factor TFIIB
MPRTCEYCEIADGAYRRSRDEYICADCVQIMMERYGEKFPDEEIRDVDNPDDEECGEAED